MKHRGAGRRAFAGALCALCAAGIPAFAAPGASVPWVTYEAEDAVTTGAVLGPDFTGDSPAREASGRRCVRLDLVGQYVDMIARADADGLVVRYSIPDTPDGRGRDATIGLYVNGTLRTRLPLTSRYSHLYGDYPYNNNPASGRPRHRWDEVRALAGPFRAGDTIRLRRDADDNAAGCLIDFVELEPVPGPLSPPQDALSVTGFGAVADDGVDDRPAFQAAIDAGRAKGLPVWIPPGRFVIGGGLDVAGVAVRGAGMWHSTLVGIEDYAPTSRVAMVGRGGDVVLSDFAIVGRLTYRNDGEDNDGIVGTYGTGSVLRNVWVEHTKAGAWVVNSDGLRVEGCRFRNTLADGINLCVGMRNAVVRDCSSRGTGDDGFAIWPATYRQPDGVPGSNLIAQCTAQLPSLAQGFSIYGGDGNRVEDCAAIDIPRGAGAMASSVFPTEFGFRGTTVFRGLRIVRAGDNDGALALVAGSAAELPGVRMEDIDAVDGPRDGVKFTSYDGSAIRGVVCVDIRIERAGRSGSGYGVVENPGAVGSATMRGVRVSDPASGGWKDDAPAFDLVVGEGNVGLSGEPPPGP